MTKKALCVGINDYPIAGMDLKGCVNDAKAWSTLLRKHYDFCPLTCGCCSTGPRRTSMLPMG